MLVPFESESVYTAYTKEKYNLYFWTKTNKKWIECALLFWSVCLAWIKYMHIQYNISTENNYILKFWLVYDGTVHRMHITWWLLTLQHTTFAWNTILVFSVIGINLNRTAMLFFVFKQLCALVAQINTELRCDLIKTPNCVAIDNTKMVSISKWHCILLVYAVCKLYELDQATVFAQNAYDSKSPATGKL